MSKTKSLKVRKLLLGLFAACIFSSQLHADEGMWLPLLLKEKNIEEMQSMGLKLSAEDIYSVNNASLKDAIVIFGGGCTGEVISNQGLLLTNHHCGYGSIQSQSSVENDYLTDGYWASTLDEELPIPGLKATFLVRMEDVTDAVLEDINVLHPTDEETRLIEFRIDSLEDLAIEGTNYTSTIKPFYYGNEYYLFVYEVFNDVRLVGAPPSSIGNFGGDPDNWMWPRHTGDFSLFRIYANEDNMPAGYDEDNVPYKPRKHLKISTSGIEEGDFTMVFGYPGSTEQFLTSHHVDYVLNQSLPEKVDIRTERLEIMEKYMKSSDKIRIQYASKQKRVSNAWKKWQGMIRGLKRLDAIQKKETLQQEFQQWAQNPANSKYQGLIAEFNETYQDYHLIYFADEMIWETLMSVEIVRFASNFSALVESYGVEGVDNDALLNWIKGRANGFYKDYHAPLDEEMMHTMLQAWFTKTNAQYFPEEIQDEIMSKYKGDYQAYAEKIMQKSIFSKEEETMELINGFSEKDKKKITRDPIYKLYNAFRDVYLFEINDQVATLENRLDSLYRIYVTGLRTMQDDKVFYPDANFTLRITYGKVQGYYPRDGVSYNYFTTLDGVFEKEAQGHEDYQVPEKLESLYKNDEFQPYGSDSTMNVCFIASNHTSGGNSGSPVLNADGHLIGLNFDRNWEGTMSDIMYDPSQCRNISVDIRYVLFVMDNFAGADHLIEELTIVE